MPDALRTPGAATVETPAGDFPPAGNAPHRNVPQPICSCGAVVAMSTDARRCSRGHQLSGADGLAFKNGVRRFETTGHLPDVTRLSIDEWRESILRDLGGVGELSTVMQGYVRRLSELETTSRLLADHLARNGILSPRGRVRSAYGQWLATIDRWQKVAEKIGIERRSKPVSFTDYLAQRATAEQDDDKREELKHGTKVLA